MRLETLLHLRILVPGAIIYLVLVVLLPIDFYNKDFFSNIKIIKFPLFIFVSYIFGYFYDLVKLRGPIFSMQSKMVDDNIKDSLLSIYGESVESVDENDKQYLKSKRLMSIFYHIIDQNNSLEKKSRRVYLNGLIWTTFIDAFIIFFISTILSAILGFFVSRYFIIALIFFLLAVATFLLSLSSRSKQIDLSNRQLKYIKHYCKKELVEKIKNALKRR